MINVYDFDHTIYDGDASIDFWRFHIKKHPALTLLIPYQFAFVVLMKLKVINRKKAKEAFFCFLKFIKDLELNQFWDHNQYKIKKWYIYQKEPNDLVISASPEFLLKEITSRLNIQLIATRMSSKTGKISGENCRGEEKVKRFKSQMKDSIINQFYSDSQSDLPMKRLAKKSYLVFKTKVKEWH